MSNTENPNSGEQPRMTFMEMRRKGLLPTIWREIKHFATRSKNASSKFTASTPAATPDVTSPKRGFASKIRFARNGFKAKIGGPKAG